MINWVQLKDQLNDKKIKVHFTSQKIDKELIQMAQDIFKENCNES